MLLRFLATLFFLITSCGGGGGGGGAENNAPENPSVKVEFSKIEDVSIQVDGDPVTRAFTVSNLANCRDDLKATSSDKSILPELNLEVGGTYPDCSIVVSPKTVATGKSTVTITQVADQDDASATSFEVTVIEPAEEPKPAPFDARDFLVGQKGYDVHTNHVRGLKGPTFATAIGSKFYVIDDGMRILIYNSIPNGLSVEPDAVIGQDTLSSIGELTPTSATTLNRANSIASDGTKFIVADMGNHRVLIWNTIPTGNTPADVVLGQANFSNNQKNAGNDPTVSPAGLNFPTSVHITADNKLIVADKYNNRVLIWNTIPTSATDNGKNADIVVGQANLTSSTVPGTPTAASMYQPESVFTAGGKLFVADTGNRRVLIFNSIPTASNASANHFLGQTVPSGDTSNFGGLSESSLRSPNGVYSDGTALWVSDLNNNRIQKWDAIPTSNNVDADLILGQPNETSADGPSGGVPSASNLYFPGSVTLSGSKVIVADIKQNRVLIWDNPTTTGEAASVVVGQPTFLEGDEYTIGTTDKELNFPSHAVTDGKRLAVSVTGENRVLVWNEFPQDGTVAASFALGQPSLTDADENNGGVSASSLNYPSSVAFHGDQFIVADEKNHRVLIWKELNGNSGQPADIVLGQPDMTTNTASVAPVTASNLNLPNFVHVHDGKLLVIDSGSHRILIWNTFPTQSNVPADLVLGQGDFTGASLNMGNGAASAKSLYNPLQLATFENKLLVADRFNRRILIWNTFPTASAVAADVVLGQPDFVSRDKNNGGLSDISLDNPAGLTVSSSGKLYVSDSTNHRILIWDSVPTENRKPADAVRGQSGFVSETINQGGLSKTSVYYPWKMSAKDQQIIFADRFNHRVIGFKE